MFYGERPIGPIAKPERRVAVKKRSERTRVLSRAQCRQVVYTRENWRCQRCGRKVTLDCWPWEPQFAEVNEPKMRSCGANPHNPDECELVCHGCHMTPSGEHCPTQARREKLLALSAKAQQRKREAGA